MHRRPCKERSSYLLLEKREWNRLKKQAGPPEEPSKEQNEYLKSLIEKSQAWTSKWPDNEQCRLAQYEEEVQKQREADIAELLAHNKNSKLRKRNEEAMKRAKEKLFRESCYGKKLLFALHESKALEEREVQIQFAKYLKEQKESHSQQIELTCSFGLDKREIEAEKIRKCELAQAARQNKEMDEKHKAEIALTKEAQKIEDLENTHLMQKLLRLEAAAEEKVRLLENEARQQYETDSKKSKEEKANLEAEYNAKIEKCYKEKEVLNAKIKKVIEDMHKGADDLPWAKKNYEAFKQRQEKEKERATALEEKLIKINEYEAASQEQESKEKEHQDLVKRLSIAETNKAMAEYEKLNRCPHLNKCICDRQSLFVKSHKSHLEKQKIPEVKAPPYMTLRPCNKLTLGLKKRMREPPPWTGLKTIHEEFARQADLVLKECKYKKPVRRVIDEYIKYNRPDSIDISNYK